MRWFGLFISIIMLSVFCLPVVADNGISDDEIYDKVRLKLAGDREVRGTALEVEVEDGVVTLRGRVDNQKAKKKAEKLTRKQKGVKKVINELTVPQQ